MYKLTADCSLNGICEAPIKCMEYDAVFNIFNFITSTSFMSPNVMFYIVD